MSYRLIGKLLHDDEDIRNRVATRIFFENAPAKTQGECIVIRLLSGDVHNHLTNESDCAERTYQIDFYSQTDSAAESGFEHVRNRLSGFGPATVEDVLGADGELNDVAVSAINMLRPSVFVDAPANGSDVWTKRHTSDFQVFYTQTVPTHA